MNRQSARKILRGGEIPVPEKFQIPKVTWSDGIDYRHLDQYSEGFKWWLSCLGFLRLICTAERLGDDDEKLFKTIVQDWQERNRQSSPDLSRAWDPHAVAQRTSTLVDVAPRLAKPDWIVPVLNEHKQFLLDPTNFQGNWNHGIDQARALLSVSSFLSDEKGRLVGVRRLRESVSELVDSDGVTIEQSVHYHYYNYQQLSTVLPILESEVGLTPETRSLRDRMEKMPTFLAHATRPDGTWFELGDTPREEASSIAGTVAEYAATGGKRGPKPDENIRVYSAGYIFGRSGWGERQRFSAESAYAIRFGPDRKIHGHFDELSISYVSKGKEVIRDGGFHGYTDDSDRSWLRSPDAHSTLVVKGARGKGTGKPSTIVFDDILDARQSFTIKANPNNGLHFTRSVYIQFDPEILVVWDRVENAFHQESAQRWILPANSHAWTRNGVATVSDATSLDVFLRARSLVPAKSMRAIDAGMSGSPKISTGTLHELASGALIEIAQEGTRAEFLTAFSFDGARLIDQLELVNEQDSKSEATIRTIRGQSGTGMLHLDPDRGIIPGATGIS